MIVFNAVSKRYGAGGNPALSAPTLHVGGGEFLVLIGASGCGKTTTLNLINRLSVPNAGSVLVDGEDIARTDPV